MQPQKMSLSDSSYPLFAIMSDDRYSDVTFVLSDTVELKSHRNILGYYSKVFAKIFDESSEIPIRISVDGFEVEIVKAASEFLHGKFDAIKGKEKEVRKFAEVYEIEELKTACNLPADAPVKRSAASYFPVPIKKPRKTVPTEKPRSAFFFWMGENRDELKKPGMSIAEVAIEAGRQWAKLEDKTKWEKMAELDKSRYEKEIAQAAQKLVRPRKPTSAFFYFVVEHLDLIKKPEMVISDVVKEAGIQWGNLEDKTKWEKMAEDDKIRYEKEMAVFLSE